MSATDLLGRDLVDWLGGRLRRHRVAPPGLMLEITETALLADHRG